MVLGCDVAKFEQGQECLDGAGCVVAQLRLHWPAALPPALGPQDWRCAQLQSVPIDFHYITSQECLAVAWSMEQATSGGYISHHTGSKSN